MTHFTHPNEVLGKETSFGQDNSHVFNFEEPHEIWVRKDGRVEEVSSGDIEAKKGRESRVPLEKRVSLAPEVV